VLSLAKLFAKVQFWKSCFSYVLQKHVFE
jgi:hypothetical protein